ncbi:DUF1173 family protein [Bacillus haynesii]|uniref:DUF1173 family protein n=1 Tax=Bacillus haynesii TaxID=1925021 RepID=UPI00227DCD4A|nr:DUF1173 family protein [Bacillus haynesii]MCY8009858.1 DUF1173 family protein [Bacillus haynesii]
MDYFLKVKYLTGKFETFSYETINEEFTQEQKEEFLSKLRRLYKQKKISLHCLCNEKEDIKMKITFRNGAHFISTYQGDKGKHSLYCNYYGDSYSSIYHQNWIEKDGYIEVKFENTDFVLNKQKRNYESKHNPQRSVNKNTIIQNKINMFAFLTHFITDTWNRVNFYRWNKNKPFPTKLDIYSALHYTSKKIGIGRGLTLDKVLYRKGNLNQSYFKEKKYKRCMFVLLLYSNYKEKEDCYSISLNSMEDQEIRHFTCSKQRWELAIEGINLNENCWVGGWVRNMGENNSPEFIDLAIVSANSYGLWSESSYEIMFYDLLCQEKRFFQKPYSTKYHPEWNGMKPDAILLDTSPKTIIEVFGRSISDEAYHVRRNQKIQHFSNLEKYNFWYWDAFKDEAIPLLPKIHATTKSN